MRALESEPARFSGAQELSVGLDENAMAANPRWLEDKTRLRLPGPLDARALFRLVAVTTGVSTSTRRQSGLPAHRRSGITLVLLIHREVHFST